MVEVGSLQALDILSSAAAVIAEARGDAVRRRQELPRPTRTNISALSAPRPPNCSPPPARWARWLAQKGKSEIAACRSYGMKSRHRLPVDPDDALDYGGKSAKLGKNVRRRFPRGQDHAAGGAVVPARFGLRTRVLEQDARSGRDTRRRSRHRDGAEWPSITPSRTRSARPPLRRESPPTRWRWSRPPRSRRRWKRPWRSASPAHINSCA